MFTVPHRRRSAMRPFGIAALLFACGWLAPVPSDAAQLTVHAGAATAPIDIDGRIDEAAWQQAGAIADLVQQDPHPGQPTPFDTRVLFLHDADHIYIGIMAADPHPDRLSIHSLQRDADQTDDDHITIVLDTFGNRRTGYIFQVNAGGARTDGLISASSGNFPSYDFDAIWFARTARTANGWTAEIAIDTQSLQFDPDLTAWGLNINRYVPRRQLTVQWSGHALNASIYDLSRAGLLTGVNRLRQGVGLEVAPYGLVRSEPQVLTGRRAEAGVDIKYNLTPQLLGILTVNPDFAEAEADTEQINLTRFALSFPEQRAFFLEGSNLFDFASGMHTTHFTPYYSRRIGLVDGFIVPIDAGAKVIGHAGHWSIGALGVKMQDTAISNATQLFVGRTAYDVNRHLRIGALVTRGDPAGRVDNSLVGIDAIWHTSQLNGDKTLNLYAWGAKSFGDLPAGRPTAWGVRMQYPNDVWYHAYSVQVFGDAFDPRLGFLARPGTRQYHLETDYRPRPAGGFFDWVRQFDFTNMYDQINGLGGHKQSIDLTVNPLKFTTEGGYDFETTYHRRYESLPTDFEIAPGVVIPVGDYYFNRYHAGLGTPDSAPGSIFVGVDSGSFYTGTLKVLTINTGVTVFDGRLHLGFDTENDFIDLPQGDAVQRLHQVKVAYSFSPDTALSSFAQYNTLTDTTGVKTRFEWIISPGRRLFLVWNHGLRRSITAMDPTRDNIVDALIAKLQWDFRW